MTDEILYNTHLNIALKSTFLDELFEANFPRRIPLEDFSDESLKRLDLFDEKKQEDKQDETSNH